MSQDSIASLSAALSDRYRIERELGQGGMATVYLAQDIRHGRQVALKVLRPELAAVIGAERFLQEIKTTANLQHPHILPLHDSGKVDGTVFYVMPYVQGESLRDLLNREKQLPIDAAIRIAREVASALDYAHRHGVIHRDIKPENILLHDGQALVADFGIALAATSASGGRMTETGMSLGTPTYMSPEQAMGERTLDARTDVYALGCVLYEMLTGEPPFTGPTAQSIVAKVMTDEPRPPTQLRKTVPSHVGAVALIALSKLPADRFATAAQFAEALVSPGATFQRTGATAAAIQQTASASRWRTIALIVSAVAVAASGFAIWTMLRSTVSPGEVSRFAVVLDSNATITYSGTINEPSRLAISPDGGELVYTGYVGGGFSRQGLYLREMGRLDARLLPGTDSAVAPAISPDGAQVAFMTGWRTQELAVKVVSLRGGPPVVVQKGGVGGGTISWGLGGFVYFIDASGQMVRRVASSGGPPEDVVRLVTDDSTTRYGYLSVLPGGRSALVASFPANFGNEAVYSIRGVDFETGKLGTRVPGVAGIYTSNGQLLYVTYNGTLMGVGFDPQTLTTRGRPAALIEGLDVRLTGLTDFAVSESGTLVYVAGGLNAAEDFVWVSRTGELTVVDPDWGDPEFENFELSPDGKRAAVTISASRQDIWIKQLDRGAKSRLTFGGAGNWSPSWSPDGRYVSFISARGGPSSLWRRRADGVGVEELVAKLPRDIVDVRWSRDGKWLLLSVGAPPSSDVFAMQLGVDSTPRPLLTEAYDEGLPALSPDGRWLAYVSTETGSAQVFVRPFPAVQDGKWQISTGGGDGPLWGRDSRELVFRSGGGGTIYSVDMAHGPGQASPRILAQLPALSQFESNGLGGHMFEMSPDGRRFLMVRQGAGDKSGDLIVVLNFFNELRAATARSAERK